MRRACYVRDARDAVQWLRWTSGEVSRREKRVMRRMRTASGTHERGNETKFNVCLCDGVSTL